VARVGSTNHAPGIAAMALAIATAVILVAAALS
jgi:hypothetical protein